ncbi:hypothetical protein CE91St45_27500 [Oscillospiraceae bacterium]|nr:hypothetical protein CE91St45_27500 [Oscillospiraceae bacterium]
MKLVVDGIEFVPAKFQRQDGWTMFVPADAPDPTIPTSVKTLILTLKWRYAYGQV